MNTSDYKKPRTLLNKQLPTVLQNDVNQALFENTFNRFLSKTELKDVFGTIGVRNLQTRINQQIDETTPHRQAYQLQPLVYKKQATEEHVMSYEDILNKLTAMDVKIDRIESWGDTERFNWAPPINLDKLLNFSNYVWVDNGAGITPQYITIESRCNVAKARLAQKRREVAGFVDTAISQISVANNTFSINGDFRLVFDYPGLQFDVINSSSNDGRYTVVSVAYDSIRTTITVVEPITSGAVINGSLTFDGIVGDYEIDAELACSGSGGGSWDSNGWDDNTSGSGWDLSGSASVDTEENDWSRTNFWVHRLDADEADINSSTIAKGPIIEYSNTLQLNNWNERRFVWKSRTNTILPFETSDRDPTISEIQSPDFLDYWLFVEELDSRPTIPQPINATPVILNEGSGTLVRISASIFQFNDAVPPLTPEDSNLRQAIYNASDVRAFVDDIEYVGRFVETPDVDGLFVVGLEFFDAIPITSVVEVIVSPSSSLDIGRESVGIRHIENDTDWTTYLLTNDPMVYSLIRYRERNQTKTANEIKYPIFDLYTLDGTSAFSAEPIFAFAESGDYPIVAHLTKRAIVDSNNIYTFEQTLVADDETTMYAYVDKAAVSQDNPLGLQTIWKLADDRYIPRFVDELRHEDGEVYIDEVGNQVTASVNSSNGDWELADQLYYNVSHENRKFLTYSELVGHFQSILSLQTMPGGFFGDSSFAPKMLSQSDFNYGVGGTIREYNDSYDLMISSLFVNNVTPIDLVNFAYNEYEIAINTIKELFRSNVFDLLLQSDANSMINFIDNFSDQIIKQYEDNDNANLIYGDSTTYDVTTELGVVNFPATLPFVKMQRRVKPIRLVDDVLGLSELGHHDGHISSIRIAQNSAAQLKELLINYPLNPSRKRGWTDVSPADGGLAVDRLTVLASRLLINDYWLESDGTLYRLQLVSIGSVSPSNTGSLPDGVFWLRTTDYVLLVRDSGNLTGWTAVTGIPHDLDAAWVEIDLSQVFMDVLYEVENRLYDVAPDETVELAFTADDYILNSQDQAEFDRLMELEFLQFASEQRIVDPYATDYKLTNAFTWNYGDVNSVNVVLPNALTFAQVWGSRWTEIYSNAFNTPYPHLTPWKMQGYIDKPTWWDAEYADITGTRRWTSTMWFNIKNAIIPGVYTPPTGPVPTYTFVSVNTTSNTTTDGYAPDSLLPPLWVPPTNNAEDLALATEVFIRTSTGSLGVDFSGSYVFGEYSPAEWLWRKSSHYLYASMRTAFKLQPVRYVQRTLGLTISEIDQLQVDLFTQRVFRHQDTNFHGDLVDNVLLRFDGTLQWYVNYNRKTAYDSNVSDFRSLWNQWDTKLGYQFAKMIESRTLNVRAPSFFVTDSDRSTIVKKSPGFRDLWFDGLTMTVTNIGKSRRFNGFKIPKTDAADWKFIIDTPSPINRSVEYYNAYNLSFMFVDVTTGLLRASSPTPWITGDPVTLKTSGTLPSALNSTSTYYYVRVNNTDFYLADTHQEAINGVVFSYDDEYISGEHKVKQVVKTFTVAESGSEAWCHHQLGDQLQSTLLPITIMGLQSVIDFIDGYCARQKELGIIDTMSSASTNTQDYTETGRLVSWQTETENAISQTYLGLGINNSAGRYQGKAYQFSIDILSDALVVDGINSPYTEGDQVYVFTNGLLPAPLQLNTPYYIIRVPGDDYSFKLASSKSLALSGIAIDIVGSPTGAQFIGAFSDPAILSTAKVHVNPYRYNVRIKHEQGVVADINNGPYKDIKRDRVLFDQYGEPFRDQNVNVYRLDSLTHINVDKDIADSPNPTTGESRSLFMGGAHIFFDSYEHVMLFNNKTLDSQIIYDGFLGLNIPRFLLNFKSSVERNYRPNVGGYTIDSDGKLNRNIEGIVEDFQQFYDVYQSNESTNFIQQARKTMGYDIKDMSYLDQLGATDKTKFIFWKGMIQSKGSTNAINAYINSIEFIDANVDEYWAYKVSDYGDRREKSWPTIELQVDDVRNNDIKLQFSETVVENGWLPISTADSSRWENYPDIAAKYQTNPLFSLQATLTYVGRYKVNDSNELYSYDHATSSYTLMDGQYITTESQCDQFIALDINSNSMVAPDNQGCKQALFTVVSGDSENEYDVYSILPSKAAHSPIRILDKHARTTVIDVPLWDPAVGYHYHVPYQIVDYDQVHDPVLLQSKGATWASSAVGTVWLDSSLLFYVSYHDINVFDSNDDKRIAFWGKLADFSSINLRQWVQSTVPPSEYSQLVSEQQNDDTVEDSNKATGTPVKFLFKKVISDWIRVDERTERLLVWNTGNDMPDVFSNWPSTAEMTVYVNGFSFSGNTISVDDFNSIHSNDISTFYNAQTGKSIDTTRDVVYVIRNITDQEITNGDFKYDYDPVIISNVADNGVDEELIYYFWSTDNTNIVSGKVTSVRDAAAKLKTPNVPYSIIKKPVAVMSDLDVSYYTQVMLRRMENYITADGRYQAQLVRDFTLRDTVADTDNLPYNKPSSILKNVHHEWETFRRQQLNHVPRTLWNKLTESVVRYQIEPLASDQYVPVPALDRIVYDDQYNTTSRYGLRDGQSFTDGTRALEIILELINEPDFDPYPVNKVDFLTNLDTSTPQGRLEMLNIIYNQFPSSDVNNIFFEVLTSTLTYKRDYSDIMKTSWISVHGIKLLNVAGSTDEF